MAGGTDPAAGPVNDPADTVADSVGDRAAVVGSAAAVVGMADRPEESGESEIPTEARVGVLGVPVPGGGQAARRGDSIPAGRRAMALAELSPARLCLTKMNAFADVVHLAAHLECPVDTVRLDRRLERFGQLVVMERRRPLSGRRGRRRGWPRWRDAVVSTVLRR